MSSQYYLPPASGDVPKPYTGVDAGVKPGGFENPMYPSGVPSGKPSTNNTPYPTGPPVAGGQPPPGHPPKNQGFPPTYPPPNQTTQQPAGPFVHPLGEGPPPQGKGKDDEGDDKPTAPPLEGMPKNLPGYEHLSFEPAFIPPPTYEESERGLPPQRQPLPRYANVSPGETTPYSPVGFADKQPDEARDILLGYVSENCCYGKAPARDMVFENINMTSAFHYKLETFTEKRQTSWEYEPYNGRSVLDGPMNGPAPHPWSIAVSPPAPFTDGKKKVEVPHTAFSKMCHRCGGGGRVQCRSCWGRGRENCTWCNGTGYRVRVGEQDRELCNTCSGTGSKSCFTCSGSGMVKCRNCDGNGQLKCFVQLTITWKNNVTSHVYETAALPAELICTVKGAKAFEERMPRVWPITHFPTQAVNEASQTLIQQHTASFQMEKILEQRHSVEVVPVSAISYTWKDHRGEFFIYGLEDKVHFPDYPATCCCGCSIL